MSAPLALVKRDYDYLFKLVIIGDSSSGKTALMLRFADNAFCTEHVSTVGVDFRFKTVKLKNGKVVKLQIWDTAGQERFRNISAAYYRGSDAIVLVYDVTNPISFDHISEWTAEADRHATTVQKMLIGNKTDLVDKTKVETKQAQTVADQMHCLFFETSAKTDQNVQVAFDALVKALVQKRESLPKLSGHQGSESVDPSQHNRAVATPCCR